MPLVTAGRDVLANLAIGTAGSSEDWSAANAQLVVGDSTGAFGSSQNDMGSSGANRVNSSMDATYPQISSSGPNILLFRSTIGTASGNFHWQEIGVKNTSASAEGTGALLQRLLDDLGTKTSAQSWQATLEVTVST